MKPQTVKIILPLALIGGGLGSIAWGIRPKSGEEKRLSLLIDEERARSFAPPPIAYTNSQKDSLQQLSMAFDYLRSYVRKYAQSPENRYISSITKESDYLTAYAKKDWPWPEMKSIGVVSGKMLTNQGTKQTDMISPAIQKATGILDLCLWHMKFTDLPETITVQQMINIIGSIGPAEHRAIAAGTAAYGGTMIEQEWGRDLESANEHLWLQRTPQHLPLNSKALAGISLYLPVPWGPSWSELAKKRELLKRPFRQPRVVTI